MVQGIRQSINYDAPGIEGRYWGRVVGEVALRLHPTGVFEASPRLKSRVGRGASPAALEMALPQAVTPVGCVEPDGQAIAQRVLILGLGGGTVAHLLARAFPGAEITGVELDPQIIDVARRFFDLDQVSKLKVVCADAADVAKGPGTYDLVLSDLYCGGRFPEKFAREEFLVGVKNLLAPQGLAIFNRVLRRGARSDLDDFVEKVGEVFAIVEEVEVPGPSGFANLLLLATNDGLS